MSKHPGKKAFLWEKKPVAGLGEEQSKAYNGTNMDPDFGF